MPSSADAGTFPLGVNHIDTAAFYFSQRRSANELINAAPFVAALADLVEEGLVGHVGVSAVTIERLEAARAVTEVVSVQNRFSVDSPEALELLRRCGELGIAFVPFFTVAGSARQGNPGQEPEAVLAVADELEATPAQVRIAWTLALGEHVLVVPGTGSVGHVEENVAAGAVRLTDEQVERLTAS